MDVNYNLDDNELFTLEVEYEIILQKSFIYLSMLEDLFPRVEDDVQYVI